MATLSSVWTDDDQQYLVKTLAESNGFSPTLQEVATALAHTSIIQDEEDCTEVLVDDLVIRYVDGQFELEWV